MLIGNYCGDTTEQHAFPVREKSQRGLAEQLTEPVNRDRENAEQEPQIPGQWFYPAPGQAEYQSKQQDTPVNGHIALT